jgi:endonuclease YncB( thermonuclease family)
VLILATLLALATPAELPVCSGGDRAARGVTCLVDGDTGWEAGAKWRLLDVDTPEYGAQAACPAEVEMAKIATYRMLELMRGGYTIEWHDAKDRGGDRELVTVRLSDGRNAGIVLVEEGLAVAWPHRAGAWCD